MPLSAIFLLCGESDLVITDVPLDSTGATDEMEEDDEEEDEEVQWRRGARNGDSTREAADRTPERTDDVVAFVEELGEWCSVRLSREAAHSLQALRGLLRFVFRVFCSDPKKLEEITQEGETGAVVLDLATEFIRADAAQQDARAKGSRAATASVPGPHRGAGAADWRAGGQQRQAAPGVGRPRPQQNGGESWAQQRSGRPRPHQVGGQQQTRCEWCSQVKPPSQGTLDYSSGKWYCFDCWDAYQRSRQAPAGRARR